MFLNSMLVLLVLAMASQMFAQIPRKGKCPNYTEPRGPEKYNINDFSGRWYEFAQTPRLLEPFTKCVYLEFSQLHDGKISIATNQRTPGIPTRVRTEVAYKPTNFGEWKSISGFTYRIFATDNSRFAVLHACRDGLFGSSEIIWILTREKYPDYPTAFEAQYYVWFEMGRRSFDGLAQTDQNCKCKDDAFICV